MRIRLPSTMVLFLSFAVSFMPLHDPLMPDTGGIDEDMEPPIVSIIAPTEGKGFASDLFSVVLRAKATDDNGILKIDFYCDELLVGTAVEEPWEVRWVKFNLPVGPYLLSAVAYDMAGNAALSDTVVVFINDNNLVLEEDFQSYDLGPVGSTIPANGFRDWFVSEACGSASGFSIVDDPLKTRGKVLRLQDSADKGELAHFQGCFSDTRAGILDFDFLIEEGTRLFYALSRQTSREYYPPIVNATVYETASMIHFIGFTDFTGMGTFYGDPLAEHAWHSIRVAFDCDAAKFSLRVDGTWLENDLDFFSRAGTPVNLLLFFSTDSEGREAHILLEGIRITETPVELVLPAPTGLRALPREAYSVALSWTDNCFTETEYAILRYDRVSDPIGSMEAGTVAAGITCFTDTGILPDREYRYAVHCRNGTGFSPLSDWVIVPAGNGENRSGTTVITD